MEVHHPIVTLGTVDFETWTLLGRVPVAVTLLALAGWVGWRAGWRRGALALSGACAGLAFGVALLPSVLGALAGMLLVGGLTLRLTGAPAPGPARLTAAMLAVLAVGRLGCLLGGCCFGLPTGLPWGVRYAAGSPPAGFHALVGLVGPGQPSLHLHPVQAYEGLAALGLLLLLPWLSRVLRSGLAAALVAAGGYLLVRAAVDPLRAMLNTAWSLVPVGPLSAFQLAALAAALACLLAGVAVACRVRPEAVPRHADDEPPPAGLAAMLVGQAALAWIGLPRLGPFLAALVMASLIAAAALLVQQALAGEAGRTPRHRLAAAMLALLLVPVGLRATERRDAGGNNHWVYAPVLPEEAGPGAGNAVNGAAVEQDVAPGGGEEPPARLLRIGDQSTPEQELETRAAQLAPVTTRRLYGQVAGSNMSYEVVSQGCGGPSLVKTATRSSSEVGLAFESTTQWTNEAGTENTGTWQLRASVGKHDWSDSLASTSTAGGLPVTTTTSGGGGGGGRFTFGGLAVINSGAFGFGLGGLVGRDRSYDPDGPAFTTAGGQVLYPGLYVRIGGKSIGFEGGTMALDQVVPSTFARMYLGEPGSFRFRFGLKAPYIGTEFPYLYALGMEFPIRSAVVQFDAGARAGLEASLRVGFPLP
jgi:hypothetical protein